MNSPNTEPLQLAKIFVIGVGQWKYEYETIADATAGVQGLRNQIEEDGVRLDFIEVLVEFTSGESERCAYREQERVFAWLQRFEG